MGIIIVVLISMKLVLIFLKSISDKPDLSQTENTTFQWIGNKKNITCLSDGSPAPTFRWEHNGDAVKNDGTYKVYNEKKESNLEV